MLEALEKNGENFLHKKTKKKKKNETDKTKIMNEFKLTNFVWVNSCTGTYVSPHQKMKEKKNS